MWIQTFVLGATAFASSSNLSLQTPETTLISPVSTASLDPDNPMDPSEWAESLEGYMQWTCDVLQCYSTQTWGASTPTQQVQNWLSTYQTGGVRTDLTSSEAQVAIGTTLSLLQLCENDPGVLNSQLREDFSSALMAVLDQLGGGKRL